MLTWYEALGYGALGGLIVELISLWQQLQGWQESRKATMLAGEPAPNLVGRFVDPVADGAVAVTRVLLGCGAGFILNAELTGAYAAVAVGASAPALLAHLGQSVTRLPAIPSQDDKAGADA